MRFLCLVFGSIIFAVSCEAMVSFTESSLVLLPQDGALPFYSGVAMGLVDMDGDGADDIVRFRNGMDLQIEYQGSPGAAFSTGEELFFDSIRVAVAVADHDGNGKRDLVCGGYTLGTHLLSANTTGTAFSVKTLPDTQIVMQGMNFIDLDSDGDVDVFACDDKDDNHKYRNNRQAGFVLDPSMMETLIPDELGQLDPNAGNYASIWTDYDNDGDQDMYLTKCWAGENCPDQRSRINRLFRQNPDGSFTDVAEAVGLASGAQGWCTDFADIDNDGDLDALVINHEVVETDEPSALYENLGDGTFVEITETAGINFPYFGIQALFRDFDNDGFVDLLISSTGGGYQFYLNNGDGSFTLQPDVFTTSITGEGIPIPYIHSFAVGDLNSDGWLDLYIGRANGLNSPSLNRDLLFLNGGGTHHFLQVRLKGKNSNPDGIGVRLELHGPWGIQVREVRSGEGYGVMHSLTQHFGIGAGITIDRLVVRWPSGAVDIIESPAVDQVLEIEEGSYPAQYMDWQSVVFSEVQLLDEGISGPDADPDGDGLPNLFEWYFRTHPNLPRSSRERIAQFSIDEHVPGQRRLVLTIDRRRMDQVVEFAEVSTDLKLWTRSTPTIEILEDTDSRLVLISAFPESGFQAIRFGVKAAERE